MATINFSVPEPIKREFNQLFAAENKSALLTQLMERAIAERKQQQRRAAAIEKILQLRSAQTPIVSEDVEQARLDLRS